MHRICTWSQTNGVSFCRKDCFYAFYKLGNAPKSVSAGALPRTPLGKLTALPHTAGGEGARRVLPKNPTPLRPFGLRPYRLCCVVVPQPPPPKINPSYGLGDVGTSVTVMACIGSPARLNRAIQSVCRNVGMQGTCLS